MNELVRMPSTFSERVARMLSRVTYQSARTAAQREAIFRLRYEANLREKTITANETGMLIDRYDDLPNGFNVGVFIDGTLAAALRLHLLSKDYPHSALLEAYPDVMWPKVEAGARIIDVTRLVADYGLARREPYLAYATVRLAMLAAAHFGADLVMAAVRKEHIPFYQREFMATRLTEPRPYPTLVKPLSLFEINYARDEDAIFAHHPFHASTPEERYPLFGPPTWPGGAKALQSA